MKNNDRQTQWVQFMSVIERETECKKRLKHKGECMCVPMNTVNM